MGKQKDSKYKLQHIRLKDSKKKTKTNNTTAPYTHAVYVSHSI